MRRGASGELETLPMRWGLIPWWATDPRIAFQCINARAETVATKPAFRNAFRERRCLIIVDGWYEWASVAGRRKQPYAIRMPDGAPFAFAGLWDAWRPSEGADSIETCTIVTTVTCQGTAHLHHLVNAGKVDDERCLERIAVPDDGLAPTTPGGTHYGWERPGRIAPVSRSSSARRAGSRSTV